MLMVKSAPPIEDAAEWVHRLPSAPSHTHSQQAGSSDRARGDHIETTFIERMTQWMQGDQPAHPYALHASLLQRADDESPCEDASIYARQSSEAPLISGNQLLRRLQRSSAIDTRAFSAEVPVAEALRILAARVQNGDTSQVFAERRALAHRQIAERYAGTIHGELHGYLAVILKRYAIDASSYRLPAEMESRLTASTESTDLEVYVIEKTLLGAFLKNPARVRKQLGPCTPETEETVEARFTALYATPIVCRVVDAEEDYKMVERSADAGIFTAGCVYTAATASLLSSGIMAPIIFSTLTTLGTFGVRMYLESSTRSVLTKLEPSYTLPEPPSPASLMPG